MTKHQLRTAMVIVIMGGLATGCHSYPNLLPEGTRVAVVEFTVAEDAKIDRYNAPYDTFGRELAERIVDVLRDRHRYAEVVPAGTTPPADLIVTGEITRIDGGSAAKRFLIGWGAGHATFAIMGQVRHADGTRVAFFSDERIGGGLGNKGALENARERVGDSLAAMIYRGEYRGGRPGSPGFVVRAGERHPAERAARPVSQRLRELDELKAQRQLTDEEYQERRRRILDDL